LLHRLLLRLYESAEKPGMKNSPESIESRQFNTAKILIYGRVQGVSFRRFAASCAAKTGINGYVRNLNDSRSVEAIVQGSPASLDSFLRLLEKGPPDSLIEKIIVGKICPEQLYNSFDIR
jgi:acylphosphatase